MMRQRISGRLSDWLLPLLLGVPLLVMLQWFDLDRWISSLFYDPAGQHFPWKDNWWLKTVLHDGIKDLSAMLAIVLVLLSFAGLCYQPLRRQQRVFLTLLISMVMSAGLVALIKSVSIPACPHDLLIYGGTLPRIGIFDQLPAHYLAGHCWPGGNASSAFCLFGVYFAARSRGRLAWSRISLTLIIAVGLILSLVQVMRGMHFMSHEVWTAIICWYVSLIIFRLSGIDPVPGQRPSNVFTHHGRGVVNALLQRCDHSR